VNVLFAASRKDHPYHVRALEWLESALDESAAGGRVGILPMVGSGFLRLATHPRVFVQPTPLAAAQAFLRAVLDSPGVEILPLGAEWALFERLCERHALTGNDVHNAWIAAAAQSHHAHLVTFDKGFRRLVKASQLTVLC
jgi:toxin-antitoxin system PIN domain toxin